MDQIKEKISDEVAARAEAAKRVERLEAELKAAKQRASSLEAETDEKVRAEAIHIGDGNIAEAQAMKRAIDELKTKLVSENRLIKTIEDDALPSARSQYESAHNALCLALKRHILRAKLLQEGQMSEVLSGIVEQCKRFDDEVDTLIRTLDAKNPDFGLVAGGSKLTIYPFSESFFNLFVNLFSVSVNGSYVRARIKSYQKLLTQLEREAA